MRIAESESMQKAFHLLRGYPMIGDFLAYQYVTDLNYSDLLNFSEMEFVMPGPGARSGIRKCFADYGSYSESDLIRWMADHQGKRICKARHRVPVALGPAAPTHRLPEPVLRGRQDARSTIPKSPACRDARASSRSIVSMPSRSTTGSRPSGG